jgi:hypothetical protein
VFVPVLKHLFSFLKAVFLYSSICFVCLSICVCFFPLQAHLSRSTAYPVPQAYAHKFMVFVCFMQTHVKSTGMQPKCTNTHTCTRTHTNRRAQHMSRGFQPASIDMLFAFFATFGIQPPEQLVSALTHQISATIRSFTSTQAANTMSSLRTNMIPVNDNIMRFLQARLTSDGPRKVGHNNGENQRNNGSADNSFGVPRTLDALRRALQPSVYATDTTHKEWVPEDILYGRFNCPHDTRSHGLMMDMQRAAIIHSCPHHTHSVRFCILCKSPSEYNACSRCGGTRKLGIILRQIRCATDAAGVSWGEILTRIQGEHGERLPDVLADISVCRPRGNDMKATPGMLARHPGDLLDRICHCGEHDCKCGIEMKEQILAARNARDEADERESLQTLYDAITFGVPIVNVALKSSIMKAMGIVHGDERKRGTARGQRESSLERRGPDEELSLKYETYGIPAEAPSDHAFMNMGAVDQRRLGGPAGADTGGVQPRNERDQPVSNRNDSSSRDVTGNMARHAAVTQDTSARANGIHRHGSIQQPYAYPDRDHGMPHNSDRGRHTDTHHHDNNNHSNIQEMRHGYADEHDSRRVDTHREYTDTSRESMRASSHGGYADSSRRRKDTDQHELYSESFRDEYGRAHDRFDEASRRLHVDARDRYGDAHVDARDKYERDEHLSVRDTEAHVGRHGNIERQEEYASSPHGRHSHAQEKYAADRSTQEKYGDRSAELPHRRDDPTTRDRNAAAPYSKTHADEAVYVDTAAMHRSYEAPEERYGGYVDGRDRRREGSDRPKERGVSSSEGVRSERKYDQHPRSGRADNSRRGDAPASRIQESEAVIDVIEINEDDSAAVAAQRHARKEATSKALEAWDLSVLRAPADQSKTPPRHGLTKHGADRTQQSESKAPRRDGKPPGKEAANKEADSTTDGLSIRHGHDLLESDDAKREKASNNALFSGLEDEDDIMKVLSQAENVVARELASKAAEQDARNAQSKLHATAATEKVSNTDKATHDRVPAEKVTPSLKTADLPSTKSKGASAADLLSAKSTAASAAADKRPLVGKPPPKHTGADKILSHYLGSKTGADDVKKPNVNINTTMSKTAKVQPLEVSKVTAAAAKKSEAVVPVDVTTKQVEHAKDASVIMPTTHVSKSKELTTGQSVHSKSAKKDVVEFSSMSGAQDVDGRRKSDSKHDAKTPAITVKESEYLKKPKYVDADDDSHAGKLKDSEMKRHADKKKEDVHTGKKQDGSVMGNKSKEDESKQNSTKKKDEFHSDGSVRGNKSKEDETNQNSSKKKDEFHKDKQKNDSMLGKKHKEEDKSNISSSKKEESGKHTDKQKDDSVSGKKHKEEDKSQSSGNKKEECGDASMPAVKKAKHGTHTKVYCCVSSFMNLWNVRVYACCTRPSL